MKLRFRNNSVRLRVNRAEVEQLASGSTLREEVLFPSASFSYELAPSEDNDPDAIYVNGRMLVSAPREQLSAWARSDEIGLYFELPASQISLKIAIEKDLECIDGPEAERDPDAFPRSTQNTC